MDAKAGELLARVVATYARALTESPPARRRLAELGVRDAALLGQFTVGFVAGTLGAIARGEVLARLRSLGLIDAEGRERFTGCIVVPAFDEHGGVAQIAAYRPDGSVAWLFADETPVLWNAACLKQARDVAIARDPLAGLVEIAKGREAVVAAAGLARLGLAAKDALVARRPKITLLAGAERLRDEVEALGLEVVSKRTSAAAVVEQDANGFTVEFPRRLPRQDASAGSRP
jgi:hypothetical protein